MRTITLKHELTAIRLFTLAYIAIFTLLAVASGDNKFLFYTVYLIAMTWVISHYYQRLHFGIPLVFMISIFGMLHVMGSAVHIDGIRLYDTALGASNLHYDNFVHAFGGALAALVGHNILQNHLDDSMKYHPLPFIFLLVTFGSGIGAYNERIELMLVVFLGMGAEIGGYLNNALDLVFNFCGALVASATIYIWKYRRSE